VCAARERHLTRSRPGPHRPSLLGSVPTARRARANLVFPTLKFDAGHDRRNPGTRRRPTRGAVGSATAPAGGGAYLVGNPVLLPPCSCCPPSSSSWTAVAKLVFNRVYACSLIRGVFALRIPTQARTVAGVMSLRRRSPKVG
jgi:hypothetical protein